MGVSRNAEINEIKKSYRKRARELHPDQNREDPKANEKFQDLSAAYEVLSNPKKRAKYNKCGEECLKKEGMMESGGDPFASFFGDFFHFGGSSEGGDQREIPKGGSIHMDVYVTLEELYNGNFIEV